jgi:hypothetical protein
MGRLEEACPSCGEFNRARLPVYVWAIGGLLVIFIVLMLGDPGAVVQVVGDLLDHGSRPLAPGP